MIVVKYVKIHSPSIVLLVCAVLIALGVDGEVFRAVAGMVVIAAIGILVIERLKEADDRVGRRT